MGVTTLYPIMPALALSAPLGAACAVTAVALAAIFAYRASELGLSTWSLPALALIWVNPLIALAAQVGLFASAFRPEAPSTSHFDEPELLIISNCSTASKVEAFVAPFSIGERRSWKTVKFDCPQLTSIPEGLFKGCEKLSEVNFSNCHSLISIPEGLFQGCINLSEVRFVGCYELTSIPAGLFKGCANLSKVSFRYCPKLPSIPGGLFKDCINLSDVDFEGCEVLASIPESLFQRCTNLSEVNFALCLKLTSLPEGLFKDCINLFEVHFHTCHELTSIPAGLFKDCANLSKVSFAFCSTLTSIPAGLFKDCANLSKVSFVECGVLFSIPEDLFHGCTNLAKVDFSRCRALTGLPTSILNLPINCVIDIAGCSGISNAVLQRLREATSVEGYTGPRISYSVNDAGDSNTEKPIDACLRDIATISQETIAADVLKESGRGNLLQTWLNRISECADAKKTANQPYYRAVAGILNLASRDDETYRSNIFWPVLEQASQTCGDRVALSVLHFDIQRQIFEFDKRDLAGFADLLCRGVWALSILENLAREKVKTLSFFDEIETYLGYPIKLKEALNLPICLDAMLYPHCASLTDADLACAQATVEGQLSSPEAKLDFLISQAEWVDALGESDWSHGFVKIKQIFHESGNEDTYKNTLKELTKKALKAKRPLVVPAA